MSTIHRSTDVNNGLLPYLCSPMSLFGLVIAGELVAFALVLFSSSISTFSWQQLGYTSMVVQWVILLSALFLCRLSPLFARCSPVLGGALSYLLVLVVSLLVIAGALWVMDGYIQPLLLLNYMVLSAIFSGIFLRYLYLQQQLRRQQHAELQARIQALHARIRPHFLFNSMNAVVSLIPEDPALAEKVVEDLSQLFRASLHEANLVSVEEELDLCRRYVDIEQVRLGDRLQVRWQCQHQDTHSTLPSLILQPLIENAIYHGIQRLPKGGVIDINTRDNEHNLIVSVRNPMPTLPDNQTDSLSNLLDKPHNNHIALDNIRYRLEAHYGSTASMAVEQMPHDNNDGQSCYVVTLQIPRQLRDKSC